MAGDIEEIVVIGQRIESTFGGFQLLPAFFFGSGGGAEVSNRFADLFGDVPPPPPPEQEAEPLSEEEADKLTQLLQGLAALIEDLGEDAKVRINGEIFDVGVLGRGLGKFLTALEAGALISDIVEGDFEIGAAAAFVAGLALASGLASAGPIATFVLSTVVGILVEQGVNFVVNALEQEFNEALNDFNQEFREPGSFHEFLFELFTGMEATPIFDLDISATDPSILLLGSLGETRIAKFSDGEKAAFGTTAMGLSLEASTSADFTFVNGVDSAFGASVFVGVRGNSGSDMLTNAASGTVVLDGASGNDHLVSGIAGDVLVGGEGDDILEGNEGHDTLYGSAGTDTLLAGSGDDILFVDAADLSGTVDGGSGNDTLIIAGENGLAVTASDHNVETIVGGGGNDTLRSGTTVGVTLRGGGGNDVLIGNAGVSGQSFGDKLFGGDGNDVLRSGSGSSLDIDTLEGGLGDDRIEITGLLDDRIFDEGGNDRLVLPVFQGVSIANEDVRFL